MSNSSRVDWGAAACLRHELVASHVCAETETETDGDYLLSTHSFPFALMRSMAPQPNRASRRPCIRGATVGPVKCTQSTVAAPTAPLPAAEHVKYQLTGQLAGVDRGIFGVAVSMMRCPSFHLIQCVMHHRVGFRRLPRKLHSMG